MKPTVNPSRKVTVVAANQFVAPYMATLYRELSRRLAERDVHLRVFHGTAKLRNRTFGNSADWLHGFDCEHLNLIDVPTPSPSGLSLCPDHRLLRALHRADPALVWVHERNMMAVAASSWARFKGRKAVYSTDVGDRPPAYATTRFHRHYYQWVKGLYHGSISMTQEAYQAANPTNQPRILIPHAVSTEEFSPPVDRRPAAVFRFIFVGSLDERKGVDSLIDAAAALWRERQDFEVRVVGVGPLGERLAANSGGWGSLAGHVPSKDVRHEYATADAFILPSRQDTYAVVAHEAASCGLPLLIGPGAGASQVLLDEGRNGFLINPDEPESLVTAMRWMLDHRDRMPAMSLAAREVAIRYGVEANAGRLADWLCERLAEPTPGKSQCC